MTLPDSLHVNTDDATASVAAQIFSNTPADQRVIIAHGYGIKISVWSGQLQIHDGIGRQRRTRKIPKADRTLRRIIITGRDGYISLSAFDWCKRHGVAVTFYDQDADLVSSHVGNGTPDVKLRRKQALAGPDGPLEDKGIEVSRHLLTLKLRGQSANAFKLLDNPQVAMKIDHCADMLQDASTYRELNFLEAQAANVYFQAWKSANVHIPWKSGELKAIPDNWRSFIMRATGHSANARNALDPVNAMLNYAYSIGYAEARIACISNSLDPAMGFFHADNDQRDSLALDIIETVRPDIDAYILGLLGYGKQPYKFARKMFYEPWNLVHGTVRLVAPLTHEIAGNAMQWQDRLNDVAREVAGILGAPISKTGTYSRRLEVQKAEFQTQDIDIEQILSAESYKQFMSLLPAPNPSGTRRGNPIDNRSVIAAMVFMETYRKPWAHIPAGFGVSHRTLKNRRQQWERYGTWDEIWSHIQDLATKAKA
jgi:CRISPR-associated endonuclease Cas1